jgi:hypothetical protein
MVAAWRSKSKADAVPLTRLQSHALRLLASGRTPNSYVAGGVALNREAEADSRVLTAAGLKLFWMKLQVGRRQAEVEGLGETMQLEWVAAATSASSRRNRTTYLVMCSIPWTSPRTKRPPPPTGGSPATSWIW